ncbi:MAG: alanine--tRNA ligase [Bacteroidetes bacterium]|nr:alanine--tRNA ligase [Bacteroidota bacterium]MBU1486214.1 alanine--tRNA ligase [Bacteroidota bacterium]MBU2269474.1 alanine--tRNA ligase [Bacteroidota bacterium]MBU2375524.1 alanine--tRNA ligase [Bacteroidota bacterium]
MTAHEIRQQFLDFFKSKGHQVVPSAPIVVKNDPTLMFTNAGMNQFKDLFLGEAAIKYPRVTDTQRCLRVSGKHNDLEEVGIDTYHHTMFEMLGNWSFGDYFKKEAIEWSWELLTKVYGLPKDRLYVTIFEGDEKEGLPKDQEAFDLWKQFVPEDRILLGNKKDNFWEMGETGPCGPCSEIHFDSRSDEDRAKLNGATLVNADDPLVIEIWNNVFMQFNRQKDGSLKNLPAQHVDTGMGFERLVRVIQNKTSNYDTDVFQPMIQFIAEKSGIAYGAAEKTDIAMRVMADHIRAIAFAIADGQLPSNNKAGYVIRRILRRAVRYAYQYLGFKEPFFNQLVPLLADQFEGVFDELYAQKDFVQKVVLEEENSFLRTLENGIQRFENLPHLSLMYKAIEKFGEFEANKRSEWISNEITQMKTFEINGNEAFVLSDTFGFPIDLTELMARERGWKVDIDGFEKALIQQKNRSRAATAIDAGDWIAVNKGEEVEFVGYDDLEAHAQILKYRKVKAKGKEQFQLVLDRTPFYAESGGQVGDTGLLIGEGEEVKITDTKKENGLIIHFTDKLPGNLESTFLARVDRQKRILTENNHSSTHLLHAALKMVLGAHVNQKGSLVNEDVLRFDFSHFSKVSDEELKQIEGIVNEKIRENISLKEERNVPYQQALDSGVTALFGEKYGDFVRVITFDDHYSKELCGGTHVPATGQIGYFKIVSESAVAAGVRRIEAITAIKAEEFIHHQDELVKSLKELLKNPNDIAKSVEALLEENNKLKKEVEKSVMEKASGLKEDLKAKAQSINGINFIAETVALPNAEAIKNLAYQLKDIVEDMFLVLAADIDGKPLLTVMISDNLVKDKGMNAGNLVRELAKEIQGGGGGQPFFATAGGKNLAGLSAALEKAKEFI